MEKSDGAVAAMRKSYGRRAKLMVDQMREVGFGIPVPAQGAFYVIADASKFTDDSYKFAFDLLEKAGVCVAPGVDFDKAAGGGSWVECGFDDFMTGSRRRLESKA